MDTIKITEKGKTRIIAHRGSGIETENTCAAFVAAGNRSFFGIESDVHRTADGGFVIIHDSNTERVADAALLVEQSDYATLRGITLRPKYGSFARNDLHIPDLQEYIEICKCYEKVAVLELKNVFTESEIREICDCIDQAGYLDKTIFISFHMEDLVLVRRLLPEQPVQFLTDRIDDDLIGQLQENKMDLDIHFGKLDREKIERCHAAGILVNAWTVNQLSDAQRLIDWGIDFITSDILE